MIRIKCINKPIWQKTKTRALERGHIGESAKKALLDTDFLFKAQLAQNRKREALADLIMEFEGYDFFCHEKIIRELQTHGFSPDPIPWIERQV